MRPLQAIIYCRKLYGHYNALFLMIPLPASGPGHQEELAWLPGGVLAMTSCLLLHFWVTLMRNNWVTFWESTKPRHNEPTWRKSLLCRSLCTPPLPSRGLPPLLNRLPTNMPTKTLPLVQVQVCTVIIHLQGEPGHGNNQLQHHNDCPCRRCI